MKKTFIKISAMLAIVATLSSCKDQLGDLYLNPEQTTTPSVEKFFTQILNNDRIYPKYWDMRTFALTHAGVFSQVISFTNDKFIYREQAQYTEQRWGDFYTTNGNGSGPLAHYREIEKQYAKLSAAEKQNADVFVNAAKVAMLEQTAQMVDLWGDIPFSEAGMLNLNGSITSPKFDDAKEVYYTVIAGLKDASNYFATANLSSVTAGSFKKQDILFQGDITKWRRLANSLRLRALMRISFVDEAKAKAEVLEMLNNPTQYPLLEETTQNALLNPVTTYIDNLRNAFYESNNHLGASFLLDKVLKPANDPRIAVIYDKGGRQDGSKWVANADYNAMPLDLNSTDQATNITNGKYAVLDSATFVYNSKLPGVIFTSAETHLLKAEAYERWGTTTDAATAYNKGVAQSIAYYYALNNLSNSTAPKLAAPSAAAVNDFLANSTIKYAGSSAQKLALIWTQKWVQFGFMQSVQAWSELRRTKYPQLTFVADNTSGFALPPNRLTYPGRERTFNPNYSAVSSKDTRDAKIFWDVK
ncbi:SusD/RagB family nutrient-binding outer membrane lipoprotein [Flectobacillus sp. DC10W]|uniref:SusD/RagB family nutrient-binding outer membrane lipoprotein n=1 Tax=Flectobacillus longus TaxID=2984207 RepID=A0ABT6YLA2_9BACT|nr:SusD/RagB family nutrient-binding outer membrane lipoprotein [Flectobacillus longus]MDI9864359.1 SusD/RagB family nutrient-binding outer membrane lipoprotein [Flectobacillus longus]